MSLILPTVCLFLPHVVEDSPGEDAAPRVLTVEHVESLRWRNLGPTTMGGRVTDLAVHPERSRIFWVASASGGVWKTTNAGTTFEPTFEQGGVASVGAIAVAPANPDVVWIGTGEANPRNSVSWGDGVYRSEDGGETWSHAGLAETKHIGAIAIHPTDASIVFVAAAGSTWGPSSERGLFRTLDAGGTWEHVLAIDEVTGCIDVLVDPGRPEVVYAATYQRQRDEFDSNDPAVRTGPGSGIWRSLDGGASFERMSAGLPSVDMGRIGLELFAADPSVLFAIIETERTGERGAPPRSEERVSLGIRGLDVEGGGFRVDSLTPGESGAQAGLEGGDVLLLLDQTSIEGRVALVTKMREYAPGDSAELVYRRGDEELTTTLAFLGRLMRSQARSFAGSQGGQVANAQADQGAEGHETGGVFRSVDRGTTWTRVNSLNPRPFYYSQIRVDPRDANNLYVLGISFHRSTDGGETFDTMRSSSVHADNHALWIDPGDPEHLILGNDGGVYVTRDRTKTFDHLDVLPIAQFYNVAVDNRTPYNVYGGLQDNGTWGAPSVKRAGGLRSHDWVNLNGGDGFQVEVDHENPDLVYVESQNGAIVRLNVRTGERRRVSRPGGRDARWNWNTPFLLSAHNPAILFFAGTRVFRSIDRGASSSAISGEISRTERGSATALAQSRRDEDLLYVGTDDGALWVTDDGGAEWIDLTDRLPGIEQPLYVSDIEPSPHVTDVVYVTLDGHRSDDYGAHVFVSRDAGESFASISAGLPDVSVRTIAVDPSREGLLFIGNEVGCWVSIDDGGTWAPFESGLPTVPVHELVIQEAEADLVAATHGRGIWIADIAPLQALTPEVLAGGPYLFPVQDARRWNRPPASDPSGSRHFVGDGPPSGAAIYYYLPAEAQADVELVVRDALGAEVRRLEGSSEQGLHRLRWDLSARRGRGGGGGPRGSGFGARGGGSVAYGDYSVTMEVDGETQVRRIRVLPDPMEEGSTLSAQR